jgi:ribosomal protein S18 acetylase RimI-like enzyme
VSDFGTGAMRGTSDGSPEPDIVIRAAGAGDVENIRGIVAQSWLAAYGPIAGHENVEGMISALLSDLSLAKLISDPNFDKPVAFVGGEPAATALARVEDGCLHVLRLYVLPRFQRRGLGPALLAWLGARQRAGIAIRLEVVESNEDALRFYEREGFADIGGGREIIGGVAFDVRRLERRPPANR